MCNHGILYILQYLRYTQLHLVYLENTMVANCICNHNLRLDFGKPTKLFNQQVYKTCFILLLQLLSMFMHQLTMHNPFDRLIYISRWYLINPVETVVFIDGTKICKKYGSKIDVNASDMFVGSPISGFVLESQLRTSNSDFMTVFINPPAPHCIPPIPQLCQREISVHLKVVSKFLKSSQQSKKLNHVNVSLGSCFSFKLLNI